MTMQSSFSVLVAAALLAVPATAQQVDGASAPPLRESIASGMQSGDARRLAWAAVDALQSDQRDFLPKFQAIAERWEPLPHRGIRARRSISLTPEQLERRDSMGAVLDAIVQWHGSVSPDALLRLTDDFPAAALTLLARLPDSEAEPVLLGLYSEPDPSSWYLERGAATLLAFRPTSDFVASLVKQTTVQTYAFVRLPRDEDLGIGIGSGSCGGSSTAPERKGWPQIGGYVLRDDHPKWRSEAYQTIPGAWPIHILRIVNPPRVNEYGSCEDFTPMNSTIRLALVASMLGEEPGQLPFRAHDQLNIKIESQRDYEDAIDRYVVKEEHAFDQLKRGLFDKGLLNVGALHDAAVLPTLSIVVSDSRSAKTFPLSELTFRALNVVLSSGPMSSAFQ